MRKTSITLCRYVTPQIKIFELASTDSLLDLSPPSGSGGGAGTVPPDPGGEIEGVRRYELVLENYWDWSKDPDEEI